MRKGNLVAGILVLIVLPADRQIALLLLGRDMERTWLS
jgi:hypothetical protein